MLHIAVRWGPTGVAVTLILMVTNLPEVTLTVSLDIIRRKHVSIVI